MPPCFVLLTDFGLTDPYVGQLRGVLQQQAPGCGCIDLSHGVPRFRVETGALYLAASVPYLPLHAICLAVVDPGVGSRREILCLKMGQRTYIAPDNGLLSLAVTLHSNEESRVWRLRPDAATGRPSATFHARDIMAPVAARLATGTPPEALGEEMSLAAMQSPVWAHPETTDSGLAAHILHVDHFGNCILNIPSSADMPAHEMLHKGRRTPLVAVNHYAALPAGGVGLLCGSQGYWEIAANRDSAATLLDLNTGDSVTFPDVE